MEPAVKAEILFSIVTVTYENLGGLKSTMESIENLQYGKFEWLVIDGGSTDGTPEYLQMKLSSLKERMLFSYVSERDRGIYHAMNKGVARSRGEWIIFMNAGDAFYADDVLNKVESALEKDDEIVYGDVMALYVNAQRRLVQAKSRFKPWMGMPCCHQSMFVRSRILRENPFDENLKITADFNFVLNASCAKMKFKKIDETIALVSTEGLSDGHRYVVFFSYLVLCIKKGFFVRPLLRYASLIAVCFFISLIKLIFGDKLFVFLRRHQAY